MNIEDYLERVIDGEEDGFISGLVKFILSLLSIIYEVVVILRRYLYRIGIKKSTKLSSKVISIGNITVGGTGKTPIVQLLSKTLTSKGYSVVVLNRGYKGEFDGDIGVVSNTEEVLMDAKEAGDEAYMLASSLKDTPVIVGAERMLTGKYACEEFNPDFIILDDAFQHLKVERDYNLVVIDATNPFGNGYLLPRGRLREPVNTLKYGHLFILTKVDQITAERLLEIKKKLIEVNPAATIITTRHRPTYLRGIADQEREDIALDKQRVLAVSGIGNPGAFERSLADLGAKVVEKIRFADHHSYSEKEIMEIFTLASENNVDKIITTEKDAVSINAELIRKISLEKISFEVLGIEIEVMDSEDKFKGFIEKLEVK